MAGSNLQLFSRRSFDFISTSGDVNTTLVKALDAARFREATLNIRVHARNIAAGTGVIVVLVYAASPSEDDPASEFYDATPVATVTIPAGTTTGLFRASLSANFGGFLRVVVRGNKGTSATCNGDLSGEMAGKE